MDAGDPGAAPAPGRIIHRAGLVCREKGRNRLHCTRTSGNGGAKAGEARTGVGRGGKTGWFRVMGMKDAAAAVCCEKSRITHVSKQPVAHSWYAYSLTHRLSKCSSSDVSSLAGLRSPEYERDIFSSVCFSAFLSNYL